MPSRFVEDFLTLKLAVPQLRLSQLRVLPLTNTSVIGAAPTRESRFLTRRNWDRGQFHYRYKPTLVAGTLI